MRMYVRQIMKSRVARAIAARFKMNITINPVYSIEKTIV
jgi:hypothetical protein